MLICGKCVLNIIGKLNFKKKMELLVQLTILLAILSEGSFTTVTDNGPCIEGRNYTLTCKLNKRRSIVKWMDENNVIPIVYCQMNRHCTLNPAYKGQYNYSYDPNKNEVDLIILKVDKTYIGKILVCSDGTNFGCKILNIPEYEQSLEETESGIFTATSACSSSRNVAFKWMKAFSNQELDFKPNIISKNATNCSSECEIRTKYTETIYVAPVVNETKYYVKMAVVYDTESVMSEKTDMIEEEEAEVFDDNRAINDLVPVVVVVIIVAVIIAAGAIFFWRKRLKNFCKDAKDSEGNGRTHMKAKNTEAEEFLDSNTETVTHQGIELEANMAEEGELMNQADVENLSNSTVENETSRNQPEDKKIAGEVQAKKLFPAVDSDVISNNNNLMNQLDDVLKVENETSRNQPEDKKLTGEVKEKKLFPAIDSDVISNNNNLMNQLDDVLKVENWTSRNQPKDKKLAGEVQAKKLFPAVDSDVISNNNNLMRLNDK